MNKDTEIKTFIGLPYTPVDNSYEANLTRSYAGKRYLAGTSNSQSCITKIESEPFDVPIISQYGDKDACVHKMVIVSFEDNTYITMFHEWGVRQEPTFIIAIEAITKALGE